MSKTGRNDPCPCGSGKKYQQCCLLRAEIPAAGKHSKIISSIPKAIQEAFEHHQAGRLDQAEAIYQQILQAEPDHPDALHFLGVIALQGGNYEIAVELIGKAIRANPSDPICYINLGNALKGQGQLDAAVESYQKALERKSDITEAHFNLGVTLQALGKLDAAVESYRKTLSLRPNYAEAHGNLGSALKDQGKLDEAVEHYRKALSLKPNYVEAHFNLGNVLKELGQFDEAAKCYRRALELEPGSAGAHFYLGVVLHNTGQLEDAVASYRWALEIKPDLAEAHSNLGASLKDLGQLDDAVASCRRALEIKPDLAMAHNNLGNAFKEAGRLDEAIACYRRAVALDPQYTQAYSNLIYLLSFHPSFDERSILAEVKQFASAHYLPRFPSVSLHAGHDNTPERRLRIGYVSPDFRDHCQSLFTIPLLSNHDHTRFEIYCYAQLARPDGISERLAAYADVWRSTNGKSDAQLAEMIVNDGIDILIDLTMHMANGRPLMFARKPAPVQVAWLAYPGTTGVPAIDYRLTDPWLDPPELGDDRYTETSVRLPDTFWCYDPLVSGLLPNALPALTAGYITFGCLNNFCKVSDDTLCRWGRVMARVPSSRLILLAAAGLHRQRVFDLLGRHGIAAERIEFAEYRPRLQYLQTYHCIDLCLDTLPYNGHTTSLDSYWMGVPVVTQVGHTVVGRAGWSQLNNLGLPELAAFDDQAFIDIAVALSTDLQRLSQLRHTLRGRMEASPLMDGKRFASSIETAYRHIWLKKCCHDKFESIACYRRPVALDHRDLTVVAINGNGDGSEMLPSLSHSVSQLNGARGLLLSLEKPAQLSNGIEWIKIDHPFDRTGYSFFVIYFLHHYISTSHVLIVQHDGWVLNGENFRQHFYDYDYIGVICHAAKVGDSYCEGYTWVGRPEAVPVYCGGFSLRTRKFLQAPSLYKIPPQNITHPLFANEDVQLCLFMRRHLEDRGLKFAPLEISREFGFEYLGENLNDNDDLTTCLGQHGNSRILTGNNQVLFNIAKGDMDKIYGEKKVLELFQFYNYEISFLNHPFRQIQN